MATPTLASDVVRRVGLRLQEERARRGLTLDEAAKRASLSPEHLREVEEGFPDTPADMRRGPTLSKLERIANVYGLSVHLE